ncbi:sulfatase-like hydrolase/transferase [Devosia nitrariae]|uniref:Sulfatase n=1 Tax=Devosia nitrariae TaxID=2071872 RepID=A0ABQ5W9C1_9HYPH|nr:sulfatase-like hydrolase/transferase [Devosia nitrariae]GLQ56535.1 sulfatase [Devosia nitrariae]
MSQTRPNILCIVSEDCPPRLGAYGDRLARTPNLDRLAGEGVTWRVANCTSPVCAPSRFAILTGRHAESVPPAQQMTAFGPFPEGIATYPEVFRATGYYCTNNSKTHYNCDIDPNTLWDETSGTAHWRNRPAGAPFLAVFNTMLTHESCVFERKDGPVRLQDVTVPSYLPDSDGIRQSLASYYNQVERMDAFMGERLAELEADGVAEDTIVFYYSDHGSPLPRSKRFCYDEGLGVPMIVRVPSRWRHLLDVAPGTMVDTPVSLVDLFATFLSVAGLDLVEGLQGQAFIGPKRRKREYVFGGRDRMDERYDLTRTARSARFRYIRNYSPHRIWGQHYAFAWESKAYQDYETDHIAGRLTPREERFWQRKPAEELYDIAEDPDATVNLASDPLYAAELEKTRDALDRHMLEIHDCGFIPEASQAEGWQANRNETIYPLREVIALAGLAIARDASNIARFCGLLDHPSLVMRFWAAQGLLMLAVEGGPMPPQLRSAWASEHEPTVRIALSEALGHAGDGMTQAEYLTRFIASEHNPRLRLQALCALTEMPHPSRVSLPVIAGLIEDEDEYVRGAAGYLKRRLEGSYEPSSKIFRYDLFRQSGHSGLPVHAFPRLTTR